jgi:hypothetical protein
MANIGDSLVKSSGVASIKSAYDFLLNGPSKLGIPVPPTLSSQYHLKFFIGNSNESIDLFEIDNITKTLVSTEKKNFRPYGFTHNIKLMRYEGWDIKITGKKTNPALNYLIQKVYDITSGADEFSPNMANSPIITPLFRMRETIEAYPDEDYVPRILERYEYTDIVITGYDEEVPDDNMPLTFSLELFAKSRKTMKVSGEAWDYNTKSKFDFDKKGRPSKIDDQLSKLIGDISIDNKDYLTGK